MSTIEKPRRQTAKEIWDWQELVTACTERRRLRTQNEVSSHCLELMERQRVPRPLIAQMDERVVAYAGATSISLWYMHTPKQEPLEKSRLFDWVRVFPCAGGRTTYRIDDAVNGWFANRHLPINAKDRKTHSGYRSEQWWHGQSGVYQRGQGPYYPDAGPDAANVTAEEVMAEATGAAHLTEAWCKAAESLMSRLETVLAPFRDVVVRYEMHGFDAPEETYRHDRFQFRSALKLDPGVRDIVRQVHITSPYGLTIRLKSPCVAGDGGWAMVPDMAIGVCGPCLAIEDGPQIWYTSQLLHPSGRGGSAEYQADEEYSIGLPFAVARNPQKIVEAARQWAAGRIYIPCV